MVMDLIARRQSSTGSLAAVGRDALVAPVAERSGVAGSCWLGPQSMVLQNQACMHPMISRHGMHGMPGVFGMPFYQPVMDPMMHFTGVQHSGMPVPLGMPMSTGMPMHDVGLRFAGGSVGVVPDGVDDFVDRNLVDAPAMKRARISAGSPSIAVGDSVFSRPLDLPAAPLSPPLIAACGAGAGAVVNKKKFSPSIRALGEQRARPLPMKMSSHHVHAPEWGFKTVEVYLHSVSVGEHRKSKRQSNT